MSESPENKNGRHDRPCDDCGAEAGEPCDATCATYWSSGPSTPEQRPWINPDCHEGTKILQLLARLKDIEASDGGWNGGDAVEILVEWFAEMGIDTDLPVIVNRENLSSGQRPYTVFGLQGGDAEGNTLIAGVALGEIAAVDQSAESGDYERVMQSVMAANAMDAEALAQELFLRDRDDYDDPSDAEGAPVVPDEVATPVYEQVRSEIAEQRKSSVSSDGASHSG
jgi:hypothetical protein